MTPEEQAELYMTNMGRLEQAFINCGVVCLTGTGSESSRDGLLVRAYEAYKDVIRELGTDRLVVSETYAAVPRVYTRVSRGLDDLNDSDAWMYFDRHPKMDLPHMIDKLMDSMVVETFVGIELVIRDFRNFTEVAGEYAGTNIMREPRVRQGMMAPNVNARVFDMPIGMIISMEYMEREDTMFLTIANRTGDRCYYGLPAHRSKDPVEGTYATLRYNEELGDRVMGHAGTEMIRGSKALRGRYS